MTVGIQVVIAMTETDAAGLEATPITADEADGAWEGTTDLVELAATGGRMTEEV